MAEETKYQIHLDNFDGPMDLLMHLIDKNQMDIYDIPIAVMTEQYLAYLEEAQEMDLDIASEFLLMAATLLQIKARMLLPRGTRGQEEEPEDPRAELVQRLVEYRFYKETAQLLQSQEQAESTYMVRRQDLDEVAAMLKPDNPVGNITIYQLMEAFRQVMTEEIRVEQQELFLTREEYLVEDCMTDIRQRLEQEQGVTFVSLFERASSKRKIITIFMALLELCRLGELTFQQQENFGTLWIFSTEKTNGVS